MTAAAGARPQSGGPAAGGRPQLVVPAYFHPALYPEHWQVLAEQAQHLRLVVLNLASGPGEALDEAFLPVLARLRQAGVAIAGYIDTDYGRRPIADALLDLTRYRDWYATTGVFFDRAAAAADYVDHYGALAQAARQLGAAVVAFNHGAHPVEAYANHADLLGTFEGPWSTYLDLTVPRWVRARPAHQFFHLVYAMPCLRFGDALDLAWRRNAAGAYVTDHGGDNPWDGLPSVRSPREDHP